MSMIVQKTINEEILTMTTETWFNVNLNTLDIEYNNLLRFNITNNAPNLLATGQENQFFIDNMMNNEKIDFDKVRAATIIGPLNIRFDFFLPACNKTPFIESFLPCD